MKIRIFGQSGELAFPFGESGPWVNFRNELVLHNFSITEGSWEEKADAVISHTHNEQIEKYIIRCNIPREKRILVKWEPQVVDPRLHNQKLGLFYGKIYAASPLWRNSENTKYFNWPQDPVENNLNLTQWNTRLTKAVIIQGNKFSAHEGELYSLRRCLIKNNKEQIDLYGTNWNRGVVFDLMQWLRSYVHADKKKISMKSLGVLGNKFSNYLGECSNKSETLSKYQVSIVIENSADFVSEKLFDALRSGCIPIYCGPDLKSFGISGIPQVNHSVDAIQLELTRIFNLSSNEKFKIASDMQKNISLLSSEWENKKVLSDLAKKIILDLL